MDVEIISIGTELLLGEITNTNAQFIAHEIAQIGLNSYYQTVVGDNPSRLKETLAQSLNRSDVLIITGGLGPTYDDMTKECVADVLALDLELHEESLKRIEAYFESKSEKMPKNNIKQAMIPKGSKVIINNNGTAPGILIEHELKTIILMPGVPYEMKAMFKNQVLPFLERKSDVKIVSRHLYLFGIGESDVEEKLEDLMKDSANPTVAPYAMNGTLMIRLTAKAKNEEEALELISPIEKRIKDKFAQFLYSVDEEAMEKVLVELLIQNKKTIATAESCTGGLLSEKITRVPGSSEVFHYGLCTYSNEAKNRLLSVKETTLQLHGAVSKETVVEMSENLLAMAKADYAVAISGIAGPGGGSKEKPVGLVYIALASKDKTIVKKLNLNRNRAQQRQIIRQQASLHAMKMVIDLVKETVV